MMRPLYGDAADIQRRQEEKERLARQSAEFLGPLSPSDAEQLMELRKAAEGLIQRFEREYQDLTDGQYGSVESFPETKVVRRLVSGGKKQ